MPGQQSKQSRKAGGSETGLGAALPVHSQGSRLPRGYEPALESQLFHLQAV